MEHIYESELDSGGDVSAILGPREEVIRCRNCGNADTDAWRCNFHCFGYYDTEKDMDVIMRTEIRPDGYCFWAVKAGCDLNSIEITTKGASITKPLHEQLREWVRESRKKGDFPANTAVDELRLDDESFYEQERKLFSIFADCIENEYLLLPCDKEGKPWKYMDECVYGENTYDVAGFDNERNVCIFCEGEYKWVHASKIKRPDPSVLDADGVAVKIGSDVWCLTNGLQHGKVESIADDARVAVRWGDDHLSGGIKATSLVQKCPAMDDKATPFLLDETVWHVGDGMQGIITKLLNPREANYFIKVEWVSGDRGFYKPHELTHQEPDSLEKLRDRMHEKWSQAWAKHEPIDESELHGFIDDLTALIERGME